MTEHTDLPVVSFSNLVISLASTAMVHLGETLDPTTGGRTVDLPMARHSIDALGVLEEKTQGNLDEEEAELLSHMLNDLRGKFVALSRAQTPDA